MATAPHHTPMDRAWPSSESSAPQPNAEGPPPPPLAPLAPLFRRLLLLLLLLVTGRALRDIVTYPTRVSISLLPKLTPPSLSPSTTTQTSEVCIYSQPQQCNVVVSRLKCDELQTQTQTVTRRAP
jgi:hypothetical protein